MYEPPESDLGHSQVVAFSRKSEDVESFEQTLVKVHGSKNRSQERAVVETTFLLLVIKGLVAPSQETSAEGSINDDFQSKAATGRNNFRLKVSSCGGMVLVFP